jgi:hypothetical protein
MLYVERATRTQIYLTAAQRRMIDARARREGTTLAHVVREALDEYLVGDPVDTEAALADTFGTLPDLEVPSRDEWIRTPGDP